MREIIHKPRNKHIHEVDPLNLRIDKIVDMPEDTQILETEARVLRMVDEVSFQDKRPIFDSHTGVDRR